MCARRFLTVVLFLTLIVVAGAFAIFQWGGYALVRQAVPKGHFEPARAGTGPDYGNGANWIARPGLDESANPAKWRPANWPPPAAVQKRVAVFYVHPTTYLERDRWNAPLDPGGDTEFRTRLFVQSQASAFNDAAEIWAPRYRQAAFGAFLLKSEDAQKALDLAYRDVASAFDRFLIEAGDKPIILAGHSQGALHLERLLREKIAGKPVAQRIVAAYVVGWPISLTADMPALGLPPCRSPDQTGCILSWISFGEPANPDLLLDQWEETKGFTGGERRQEDLLCVNPISGVLNGAAPAADSRGTLVPSTDMASATLEPGRIGARCDKGLLLIDGSVPPLGPFVLPGNNYHVYDYALFWGDVAGDAMHRTQAWKR